MTDYVPIMSFFDAIQPTAPEDALPPDTLGTIRIPKRIAKPALSSIPVRSGFRQTLPLWSGLTPE